MKPQAVVYFRQNDWKAIKDLVARIRNEGTSGTEVRPVWGSKFQGAQSMARNLDFVVVQQELSNADEIVQCYGSLGNDIEVHLCDANGDFVDLPNETEHESDTGGEGSNAAGSDAEEGAGADSYPTTEVIPVVSDADLAGSADDSEEAEQLAGTDPVGDAGKPV